MDRVVRIGWGLTTRTIRVPRSAQIIEPPTIEAGRDWASVIRDALASPIGSQPLEARAASARSVCILVPDDSRKPLAEHVVPLIRPLLPSSVTIGVATGKHRPYAAPPGIDWVHDARSSRLVEVGRTAHGTVVAFPPEVVQADLRILIGEIRPHYFAGWAGGAKTLFPGVAGEEGIWHNHRLKAEPGARLGMVEGNPCRADMEAAAALAGPAFLINIIRGPDGLPVDAVAGDPVAAHRAGAMRARRVFEVPVHGRARTVVVSDRAPVTSSLYQACKLLPPAGAVLAEGGTVILAAECRHGLGPPEVVNEAIYRLGVRHALPTDHRVVLVSERPADEVASTFASWAPSVEAALLDASTGPVVIMPRAGDLVPRRRSE